MRASLTLTELDGDYSILRLSPEAPLPEGVSDLRDSFVSITRTPDELSIICPSEAGLDVGDECSHGWRCLRIDGATAPSDVPGIISSVVEPLAAAGLSVFAVASFDTDHVLIEDPDAAAAALVAAGHVVRRVGTDPSGGGRDSTRPAVLVKDLNEN